MPNDTEDRQEAQEAKAPEQEKENTPADLSPETTPAEEALPENVKERTKEQFEKLKDHNQKLKEELEQYKNAPSVLERFTKTSDREEAPQQAQQPQPTQPTYQPVQPVNTGDLVGADGTISDVAELNRRLRLAEEARQQAEQAKQQIAEYQMTQQARELHNSFPEVDPNSDKFDPEAYELVSQELLAQLVKTGKQDAVAAANKMAKYFREQPKQKVEQTKAVEQLQQATSSPRAGAYADLDDADLAKVSRTDDNAILERMRRAGY